METIFLHSIRIFRTNFIKKKRDSINGSLQYDNPDNSAGGHFRLY